MGKIGCNIIVWCHVSLCIKKDFNTTHKTFSNWNLLNKLTYFILRKKSLYLFIKENMAINIITNIKIILFP